MEIGPIHGCVAACILLAYTLPGAIGSKDRGGVSLDVDWASFLARADPVFSWNVDDGLSPPVHWYDSAFTGNGMLGLMTRATANDNGQ